MRHVATNNNILPFTQSEGNTFPHENKKIKML